MRIVYKKQPKLERPSISFAVVSVVLVTLAMSFIIPNKKQKQAIDKKYKLELTAQQWSFYHQNIILVSNRLRHTNLPASEVSLMQDSVLIKFVLEIEKQVAPQIDAEKKLSEKPPVKDSVSKKNN